MKYLFSSEGLKELESYCHPDTLFAFDFDGTLSPIVALPSKASLSKQNSNLLEEIDKFAPVAIISGRSIDDLEARLHTRLSYLIGNHGLEGLEGSNNAMKRSLELCQKWKKKLEVEIESLIGVELEDKRYSLTLHYRRSPDKARCKRALEKIAQELSPEPRLIFGKAVVNIIPPFGAHKGHAICALLKQSQCKRAFFIGDDDTDEDVFELDDERILKVRVGRKQKSKADFYLKSQAEVTKLLKVVARNITKNASTS